MTHTEESLMALADALLDDSQPYIRRELTHHSLRLAIREVLAERDSCAGQIAEAVDQRDRQARRAEKAEAECERLRKDAERWKGLRKLAGFVEDGSNETVRLYQDDATKDWFVSVGKCNWFGSSLSAAIDAAIKDQP